MNKLSFDIRRFNCFFRFHLFQLFQIKNSTIYYIDQFFMLHFLLLRKIRYPFYCFLEFRFGFLILLRDGQKLGWGVSQNVIVRTVLTNAFNVSRGFQKRNFVERNAGVYIVIVRRHFKKIIRRLKGV